MLEKGRHTHRARAEPAACCAAQVCTLCVREGLVAAGGFGGELVARRVGSDAPFACR